MTTAWDAWPSASRSNPGSPTLSASPLSRSPSKSASVSVSFSPRSYDRSWMLSARMTPPPPARVPTLPSEVLRSVIRHALDTGPSIPAPFSVTPEQPYDPNWDVFSARAARKTLNHRIAARESVARTAQSLILVCKAWKYLVLSYLYAEPNITCDNVAGLAHAVLMGDRKWSDINLHPHSTPGRWITVLDLSSLDSGQSYFGANRVTVAKACSALLDLSPCVTHLRLPAYSVKLSELCHLPCVRKLRAIEGIHLATRENEEDVIRFLRVAKNLEFVGLVWVGSTVVEMGMDEDRMASEKQLVLPRLHTLTLAAGRAGPLLAALTRAHLPAFTRLVTSLYEESLEVFEDDPDRGGVRALQYAHGPSILSLTYVFTPDWPRREVLPPRDTLALHPNLVHLHLGLQHSLLNEHPEFGTALGSVHHPLAVVTVPRWPKVVAGADDSPSFPPTPPGGTPPSGPPAPGGNAFIEALCQSTKVKIIAVDGFTWVQPALGPWAAQSGDSGMMRQWATWLSRRGIELRDQEGHTAPVIARGRGSFGGGMGLGMVGTMGRRSVDGGRRSFDSGWPR